MKKVVLLSDEPVFAVGLRHIGRARKDSLLSAVCTNFLKAMVDEIQRSGPPDLLVVGITSYFTLNVFEQLKSTAGTAAVIIRVENVVPEFASQALQLGVRGFLSPER